MAAVKRVLVLGHGLSALACALGAAKAGVSVEVANMVDPSPQMPEPVHVPPNMLRDLLALGVADACVAAGFPCRGLAFADASARLLFEDDTPRLAGPHHASALGMAHEPLFQVLSEAAQALGVKLHPTVSCIRVDDRSGRVHAAFDDGRYRRYCLVIATTPATARLRSTNFAYAHEPEFIGQWLWAALVKRPPTLDRLVMAPCSPGGRAVVLPVSERQAGVMLTVPGNEGTPALAGRAQAFRLHMKAFTGALAAMREQVVVDEALHLRPLYSSLAASPWYEAGLLLFGDAAHSIAPHLGQAQAQTFEDAVVLCDVLRLASLPAEAALQFEQRRIGRCRNAMDLARQAALWQMRPAPEADLGHLVGRQSAAVATPP